MDPLLQIRELRTYFETARGTVKAVDGVDLRVATGDTLGIVGESGCGKTVLALSILGLIPKPIGRIVSGEILFGGRNLAAMKNGELRKIRGSKISMIFQEPMTSLNPVLTIGDQITEAIILHERLSKREAVEKAVDILKKVGMPSPADRIRDYPHQMSGGMRQRVMIAMALSCNPKLLLADEPTTALDVTIQAQILELIRDLQNELGTSVMIITHDLGVIAETARDVAVMYAGKIVEYCRVDALFNRPRHPYTIGLLESIPGSPLSDTGMLRTIPGSVPSLYSLPAGCTFRERCSRAEESCKLWAPDLTEVELGHFARCLHAR